MEQKKYLTNKEKQALLEDDIKKLSSINHQIADLQESAADIREEIQELYNGLVPEDVKEGTFIKIHIESMEQTDDITLRVDHINISPVDASGWTDIVVCGYGVTTVSDRTDDRRYVKIGNSAHGIVRMGEKLMNYKVISEEEFESIVAETQEFIKKPLK